MDYLENMIGRAGMRDLDMEEWNGSQELIDAWDETISVPAREDVRASIGNFVDVIEEYKNEPVTTMQKALVEAHEVRIGRKILRRISLN